MDKKIDTLYEMCDTISREIEESNEKIRKAGGKLTAGDVDYVDKLTHALKSIKTTIAMMEAEGEGGGYSNHYYPMYPRMSYGDGMSYNDGRGNGGNSYARGRNARRDSMGRYSRDGYSRDGYSYADGMESLLTEMRDMLPGLSEEKRRNAERLIAELQH